MKWPLSSCVPPVPPHQVWCMRLTHTVVTCSTLDTTPMLMRHTNDAPCHQVAAVSNTDSKQQSGGSLKCGRWEATSWQRQRTALLYTYKTSVMTIVWADILLIIIAHCSSSKAKLLLLKHVLYLLGSLNIIAFAEIAFTKEILRTI